MTISAESRKQLKEVVGQLAKKVGEEKKTRGRCFTFAELEDDSIKVTDCWLKC